MPSSNYQARRQTTPWYDSQLIMWPYAIVFYGTIWSLLVVLALIVTIVGVPIWIVVKFWQSLCNRSF